METGKNDGALHTKTSNTTEVLIRHQPIRKVLHNFKKKHIFNQIIFEKDKFAAAIHPGFTQNQNPRNE